MTTTTTSNIATLIERIAKVFERIEEASLLRAGTALTREQMAVMSILMQSKEDVTPSLIARAMYRQPHTISGLLTRMESQGLVTRLTHALKRQNMVKIAPTKHGKMAYRAVLATMGEQSTTPASVIECVLSDKSQDTLEGWLQGIETQALITLRDAKPVRFG